MEPSHPIALSDASFAGEVSNFKGVVLIDFWAAWCGPCRMMTPLLEQLATKYADDPSVKIAKLDVDAPEARQTAMEQGIMSLPTLRLFKNGEPVAEQIGATGIANLERMIEDHRTVAAPATA